MTSLYFGINESSKWRAEVDCCRNIKGFEHIFTCKIPFAPSKFYLKSSPLLVLSLLDSLWIKAYPRFEGQVPPSITFHLNAQSKDKSRQSQENLLQLRVNRRPQPRDWIPARLRFEAVRATSRITAHGDVVESLGVCIQRRIQEADWALVSCDAGFVEEGYDTAPV
jgi:hypothetical protein